jgi:hypothetical protein
MWWCATPFSAEGWSLAVKSMESVSSYQMGAFEALEWAWRLLKTQKEHSGSVDEAYSSVQELLAKVGKGGHVDFRKEISQLQ